MSTNFSFKKYEFENKEYLAISDFQEWSDDGSRFLKLAIGKDCKPYGIIFLGNEEVIETKQGFDIHYEGASEDIAYVDDWDNISFDPFPIKLDNSISINFDDDMSIKETLFDILL